jgi:hypothetical protein
MELGNGQSRRGFLRSATCAVVGLWQIAGTVPTVDVYAAAAFLRQFNTAQVVAKTGTDKFLPLSEALAQIVAHKNDPQFAKPGTPGNAWMANLRPLSEEILPGWHIDYVLVPDGYRLILRGDKYTLITDETVILYQAMTRPGTPAAKDLSAAKNFPGARSHYGFKDEASGNQK